MEEKEGRADTNEETDRVKDKRKVKKGDIITISYAGYDAESNSLFDAAAYKDGKGGLTFIVGRGMVLPGLEKAIEGRGVGESYTVTLGVDDAFGRKQGRLIQLIPTSKFKKEGIKPIAGLRVEIDGIQGSVISVSGGRTLVDFNHPLAGRSLKYAFKIERIYDKPAEKTEAILSMSGLKGSVSVNGADAKVELSSEADKPVKEELAKTIRENVKEIENVSFTEKNKEKEKEGANQ